MSPLRPCLTCQRLTDRGSYCQAHQPKKPPSPSSRAWHQPGAAKLRAQVLKRDRDRCTSCGSPENPEVHHIISVADGGANDPSNLITTCSTCHRAAHRDA